MFNFSRCALFCATLVLSVVTARADEVVVPSTIDLVAYAPDGLTLWSVDGARELLIRARQKNMLGLQILPGPKYAVMLPERGDVTELYRGPLPQCDTRHLQILKDGSFIVNGNSLQWFEPPQREQPLKLRRAFEGPQEVAMQQLNEWPKGKPVPRELMCKALGSGSRQFGVMAVSPDEKRVACAFTPGHWSGAVIFDSPITETVRVWNLESGVIESEHEVISPCLTFPSYAEGYNPYYWADSLAQLGWADNQTLVVAHDLSLRRYDATTGHLVSEWKPDNAQQAVTDTFASAEVAQRVKAAKIMGVPLEYFDMQSKRQRRPGFVQAAPPPPLAFDAAAQQLLALSADGKQLVVWDGAKLLTLWNSATGAVRILSDDADFVPKGATFSRDGTWVSSWSIHMILAWSADKNMMIPMFPNESLGYPGQMVGDVALGTDMIAFTAGASFPYRMLYPAPRPPSPPHSDQRQLLNQQLQAENRLPW